MQVFLPYADFHMSLCVLDDARLRKQRVEAKQLIDTILARPNHNNQPRSGWKNHPAAVMFRRYVPALQHYFNQSLAIYAARGGNNIKLQPETITDPIVLPHWLGDDTIHASHRSRLLFKGKLDVLADRIRRFTAYRSANAWLKWQGLPNLNACRQPEYEQASAELDRRGAPPSQLTNHYLQFGWTEPDTMEYVWPGETKEDPNRILR